MISGSFSTVGGISRNGIAKIVWTGDAAFQDLTLAGGIVNWNLLFSSPRLQRVVFEKSTDGVNYTFLGTGTATESNWALTGLNLATGQNIYVRARGYYDGCTNNGSESIQESVRNAFLSGGPSPTPTATATRRS